MNGVFAGAEIALLTLRRTRLQELRETKPGLARAIDTLRNAPETFLATVQIGITVVGATAAAFGGATLAVELATWIAPVFGSLAEDFALGAVIAAISYLSLVAGELVPKSIALRHPESYSLLVARPLVGVAWIARPLVWLLTKSSNLLLRPFGDHATFAESRLSPEELRQLVEEAAKTGALDMRSGEIASRALEFGELAVRDVMIPRRRIDAIPRTAKPEEVKRLLLESGHTRMPIYEGTLDNIVGYISAKDVLALAWEGDLIVLDDLLRPAYFVPETMHVPDLLKELQSHRSGIAFVVDEHGGLAGLVTLEDLVEELVGEIIKEHEIPEERVGREEGGAYLVRADTQIRDLNRELALQLPENEDFSTIGGLCMHLAGRIPQPGTRITTEGGWTIEVVEASHRTVRRVRLHPPPASLPAGLTGPSQPSS